MERIISVNNEGSADKSDLTRKSNQTRPLPLTPGYPSQSEVNSIATTYMNPRADRPLPDRPTSYASKAHSTVKRGDSQYSEPDHIYDHTE